MQMGRETFYHPVLRIPEGRSGRFAIQHVVKPANTMLPLSTMRTAMYGQPTGQVSYSYDTVWHKLTENDGVWMTDFPIEQRQHDELLDGMRGRVLVGGLGLGYAATALAKMRSVREIVIVERSANVAQLVWPHLDKAVHRKATLVQADLFKYLRAHQHERFRFGFYDIWTGDGESTFHSTVVPLRKLSHGMVGKVRCWNEDIMRGQLWMGLNTRLRMLDGGMLDVFEYLPKATERVRGNPYVNWAVPFWRWYRDDRPDTVTAQRVAQAYAWVYGMPEHAELLRELVTPQRREEVSA